MQSIFSSPNPLLFGTGTSKLLGDKLKGFGCSKVLVVYDMGIKNAGVADKIVKIINDAGIETVCYDGVQADPADYSVDEAGNLGLSEKIDGVVGVGGGSSLDTAKGAKLLQKNRPRSTSISAGKALLQNLPYRLLSSRRRQVPAVNAHRAASLPTPKTTSKRILPALAALLTLALSTPS